MSEPADTPSPPSRRPIPILGRLGPGDLVEPYAEPALWFPDADDGQPRD